MKIDKLQFFIVNDTTVPPNFSRYRTEPYLHHSLKTYFSKTTRQKLKVNVYSYRASLVLSEFNFTFNFCRVVFEKLVIKFD